MEAKILEYRMETNKIVTYTNNQKLDEVPFLGEMMHKSLKELRNLRKYIVIGCLHCGALGTSSQPLQRCTGCDLVAFCSTSCRKKQWKDHKILCKQFPVINGNNIYTSYLIDCDIERIIFQESINDKAIIVQLNDLYLSYLFHWKRTCEACDDAITGNLTDCECSCVSYCSDTCKEADYDHKKNCSRLKIIAEICSFYRNYDEKNIPNILAGTVQKVYRQMKSLDSDHIRLSIQDSLGKNDKWVDAITGIMSERLAYPMAILFVLQKLARIKLKSEGLSFPKTTILTIHVAHRHPVLDSSVWEYFLHQLPELKQLNVVFISPDMFVPEQSASLCSNVDIKLERCEDCVARDRIITYSVISMHYHMYNTSVNYIEPDVIAIYDAKEEIDNTLGDESSGRNCSQSFKAMIDDSNTLLVLVDSSKRRLKDAVETVTYLRFPPLQMILRPTPNKLIGFNSKRQFGNESEKVHVACLRKRRGEFPPFLPYFYGENPYW